MKKLIFILLTSTAFLRAQTAVGGARTFASTINYCADAGSNDTYACSLSPAITAYTTGAIYTFKAATVNTGAATLNLNSLGAKTIKTQSGSDLTDGQIAASAFVYLQYDGTNMVCQSCRPPRSWGATFDGGGSALVAGASVVRYLVVPYGCVVKGWDITVDAGTAGFRVWRKATGTAIPTSSDTVTSVGDLAISTGTVLHSTTATNWSGGAFPTISPNDIIGIQLNASATATVATFGAQCQ